MYDKFGEFSSYLAINEACTNQLKEGDLDAIREIAKENGLDPDDAEDFIAGDITEICNPLSAALGKISVEKEDLDGVVGLMNDWISYIEGYCTIDRNFCLAVRQEGKSLIGALGAILSESFSVMKPVDERIIEAAGVSSGCKGVKFGIPAESRVREIVRDYYLGGGADDK